MTNSHYDKSQKNCLLVFKSKKINFFDGALEICSAFEKTGNYFDKISFVAFDDSSEITFALKDGAENYENVVICCPKSMKDTFREFFKASTGGEFTKDNILTVENNRILLLFSEFDNTKAVEAFANKLNEIYGVASKRAFIKTVGATQEKINAACLKVGKICSGLKFVVNESYGDCKIEISCSNDVEKESIDNAYRELVCELSDNIYALEDIALAERLIELLKLRKKKIGFAESFTGGGVGKRLVEISGASEVYFEGLNTYSNEAKSERLGVKKETLRKYGAVSKETAFEMARGLLKKGDCDVTVATTGIAGPKSDMTNKPVGLIYISVAHDGNVSVYEYNLKGTRKQITETAINYALFLAFKSIK